MTHSIEPFGKRVNPAGRWLYRLARKAVPDKAEVPAIPFRMETLYERSGVIEPRRNFARRIRKMAEN
jgi:replication initiator protein A